jgi:predicted RNA-binding protein with TRAM domain
MELSDDLRCLFSSRIERRDGTYVVEVPERELSLGDLEEGSVYRVALLGERGDADDDAGANASAESAGGRRRGQEVPTPPVDEGDVREVEIVDIGEQGDGIAKVERGYVVIVPGGEMGDEVTVEITTVMDNYAMGEIVDDDEPEDVEDVHL